MAKIDEFLGDLRSRLPIPDREYREGIERWLDSVWRSRYRQTFDSGPFSAFFPQGFPKREYVTLQDAFSTTEAFREYVSLSLMLPVGMDWAETLEEFLSGLDRTVPDLRPKLQGGLKRYKHLCHSRFAEEGYERVITLI